MHLRQSLMVLLIAILTYEVPYVSAEGPSARVAPVVGVASAGVAAKESITDPSGELRLTPGERYCAARGRDGTGNGLQAADQPSALPASLPVRKKLILHGVDIDDGAGVIRPDALPVLNEAVKLLDSRATVVVIADKPTDSVRRVGSRQLSTQRRAEAVRSFLVSHGAPANRITIGEVDQMQALAPCDARAQNCPTELHVN